mgnify:CR=1 FL=1
MINFALDVGTTAAPESYLFYFLAPLSVLAALGMLLVKKAVHSALLLAWVMVSLAIFYIAQDALFLGIVQIVVYTGAVMMLFLFILMLVGVDTSDSLEENIPGLRPISIVAAIVVFALGLVMLYYAIQLFKKRTAQAAKQLMLASVSYITLLQIVYVVDKFIR